MRVNAICPGLIETGMTKPIFDSRARAAPADKIGQLNPLQRGGVPEEIAAMALFLASDDASYVNGQAIAVDGGLSSSLPHQRQVGVEPTWRICRCGTIFNAKVAKDLQRTPRHLRVKRMAVPLIVKDDLCANARLAPLRFLCVLCAKNR